MEKAIEIKRRAQRLIQTNDLDGALAEYEKLVALPDCDPYNFVLLADLLFKRGDKQGAVERYLSATAAYEQSALYKNAIAVLKKMMRLALSPSQVLLRLAELHALDGLGTEASLYYQQYAEHKVREQRPKEAADALRKAFDNSPEEVRLLERLSEVYVLSDDKNAAGFAMAEAASQYQKQGSAELAERCRKKAEELRPGAVREWELQSMLAPAAQPEPATAPAPPVEEEEEAEKAGPPLLPSLRPADAEVAPEEFERFPARPGAEVGLDVGRGAPMPAEGAKGLLSAAEIEGLLQQAQEKLRAGEQDEALRILCTAAQAYEAVGRHDNAATIYRSLGKSAGTPIAVLEQWLANCERREDKREAAQVACELGDRAMGEGDAERALRWFERAREMDENNLLAQRRLQRLAEVKDGGAPTPAPARQPIEEDDEDLAPTLESAIAEPGPPIPSAATAPPTLRPVPPSQAPTRDGVGPPQMEPASAHAELAPAEPESTPASRVEMSVGRSEAVTFDLGALLSEFQRGIEAQLSGDAQGHYDLAMAYREMGLLDHAVESFKMALAHPPLAHQAAEMLGRCLLEQGRFDEAILELTQALERPGLEADAATSLRYLLALSYEAAGRIREALAEFERVFAEQSSYHDVALKLRDLRKALEAA